MENEKASYFEKTKITSAGLRLIHKLIMMGEPLVITKAVIGDGISEQDPVTMTELVHEIPSRQTGQDGTSAIVDVQNYLPEDEQTVLTRVRVQNGDTEFIWRELGLIAKDPDGGEILFSYTRDNTESAMTFPVFSGVPISATVNIAFFVHNSANVEMNVTLPAEVSLAEFNEHKNAAELDHPDKSVTRQKLSNDVIQELDGLQTDINSSVVKSQNENYYPEYTSDEFGEDTKFYIDIANMGDNESIYKRRVRGKDNTLWEDLVSGHKVSLNSANYQKDGIISNGTPLEIPLDNYLCFNQSNAFTIAFSVKVPNTTETNDLITIGGTRKFVIQQRGAYGIRLITFDDTNAMHIYPNEGYIMPNSYNEYHHYVITRSADTIRWHQDGKLVSGSATPVTNNNGIIKIDGGQKITLFSGESNNIGIQYIKILDLYWTLSTVKSMYNKHSAIDYINGITQYDDKIRELDNPIYTESEARTNLTSGEKLSAALGKIKKWFGDLKAVAFTGSYNDLNNKPHIEQNSLYPDGDRITTNLSVGDRAVGDYGLCSLSVGRSHIASGDDTLVTGECNIATGEQSAILASNSSETRGSRSAVLGGMANKAIGADSIAIGGIENYADGVNSAVIAGAYNKALSQQVKMGHFSTDGTAGDLEGVKGDAFIIGNGSGDGNRSNAFRVAYNGNVYGLNAFNSTGADYAEMFEWADGNPNNEDRRGLFAYIENGKMRLATAEDMDKCRLGVIAATPAVVGDNYDDNWCGKYLTDVFGAILTQKVHYDAEYKIVKYIDPQTGEPITYQICVREECDAAEPILNPDYDPEKTYIPRAERSEYDYWSFCGKLVVVDDGTCKANGYCYPSENGVATSTENGFYVMERLDDTHIRILLK